MCFGTSVETAECMIEIVIVSEKANLSNFLKARLDEILPECKIKHFKRLSEKITHYHIIFIDEKLARKGFKKEYKQIKFLKRKNPSSKLFILGEEGIELRLKTIIDGANDYISIQSFTSRLIDSYLKRIILD